MSAIGEPTVVSEPLTNMSAIEEKNSMDMSEPGQRQKLMVIHARIKYREKVIKAFRKHLKHGTFPKRMKSIRPYPKMNSSEAQAIVNAACDQVQCVILDQMVLEEQKKLTQDQERYDTLKEQRQGERRQRQKHPKLQALLPKKPKITYHGSIARRISYFTSKRFPTL